jgi:hypothetical protein
MSTTAAAPTAAQPAAAVPIDDTPDSALTEGRKAALEGKIMQLLAVLEESQGENDSMSLDEQVWVLRAATFRMATRAEISIAKLTHGTDGEFMACMDLGLTWNRQTVNGYDAHDRRGRPCELKTAQFKRKQGHMINIKYTLPTMKKPESRKNYVTRVKESLEKTTGGHYWVMYQGNVMMKKWYIKNANMVEYLMRRLIQILPKDPDHLAYFFNLGACVCMDCSSVHKLDLLAECINAGQYDAIPKTIPSQCGCG